MVQLNPLIRNELALENKKNVGRTDFFAQFEGKWG